MGKRTKGREIVLQSMYASLISGAEIMATLEDQMTQRESAEETIDFARDLATKVKDNAADLDRWLNSLISDRVKTVFEDSPGGRLDLAEQIIRQRRYGVNSASGKVIALCHKGSDPTLSTELIYAHSFEQRCRFGN